MPKDYKQALVWFRKAADQGNADAQFSLGIMYEGSWGVRRDYKQAAIWYRKAAEQGEALAQESLGNAYRDGNGVLKDPAQAVMWYRKAAEQGDASAQKSLGDLYEAGQGVPQDYIQAYMWFNLAASPHNPNWSEINRVEGEIYGKARDKVAAKMTPAQIAEAQRLTSQWRATRTPNVASLTPPSLQPNTQTQAQTKTTAIDPEIEVTIDGFISSGSNLGLIYDGQGEYSYGGTTRNLAILNEACHVRLGEEAPCKVRFKAQGGSATEIISAGAPPFGGTAVDKPGSVFDASVCNQKAEVDYAIKPGCAHFDALTVQVLAVDGDVAKLLWNGQVKYALSQRVLINCQGTSISFDSYIGRNLLPGMNAC